MDPFQFAKSKDIDLPIKVKIGTLEEIYQELPRREREKTPSLKHVGSNTGRFSELYVTVQAWSDCKPLGVNVQTRHKTFKDSRTWNEWLELPIAYALAPRSAQLAITIWDLDPLREDTYRSHHVPYGGTTISLFDEAGTLQTGLQKCSVYRHRAADGWSRSSTIAQPTHRRQSRKSRSAGERSQESPRQPSNPEDELARLERLLKKQENGELSHVDWLDRLVYKKIEGLRQACLKRQTESRTILETHEDEAVSNVQTGSMPPLASSAQGQAILLIELQKFDHPVVFADVEYPGPLPLRVPLNPLRPPPILPTDPHPSGLNDDTAHHGEQLWRIYDPEQFQKVNPCEDMHKRLARGRRTGLLDRDLKPSAKIRDELNRIITYPPTQELSQDEKDLLWKFRHHLAKEKRALTKFIKSVSWDDSGEVSSATQLLNKWVDVEIDDALELLGPTVVNHQVRAYAVDRLSKADDEELLLYLLQLVQGLKFDNAPTGREASSLRTFLVERAVKNFVFASYLHWYIMVEVDDRSEYQTEQNRDLYSRIDFQFMEELEKQPDGVEQRRVLRRQGELILLLSKISKDIRFGSDNRAKKKDILRQLISDPHNDLLTFDPPLPLPLDPTVLITSCCPEECRVFKSNMLPLLITFKTQDGNKYPLIFKTGDDLRQDQLVIQIITLMDNLLRKENLDLRLSPYKILATSVTAGAVQFVESKTVTTIIRDHGSILSYFRNNHPDASGQLGIRPDIVETYIKSCAGYCVITYLLGVGDRHAENLLVAPSGHFFHADFGFILGRDPKPFAPAMRLSKDMIDGMGGQGHSNYRTFKQYCYTAFMALRKNSNLILNLFSLMQDANIPDIRVEPDKAVFKVTERFALDVTEEEALQMFETLIQDSANAVMPALVDRVHGLMQYMRT